MFTIVRGTTPTIIHTFKTVSVDNIVKAFLTIKQGDTVIIEKTLSDATSQEKCLSWKLTEEDTLSLVSGKAIERLNWKTIDNTRGVSPRSVVIVEDNDKDEVI